MALYWFFIAFKVTTQFSKKFSDRPKLEFGFFITSARLVHCALLALLLLLGHLPAKAEQRLRSLNLTTNRIQVLHFDGYNNGYYKRVEQLSRGSRRGITLVRRGTNKRELHNGDRISARGRRLRAHTVLIYERSLDLINAPTTQLGTRSIAIVRISSSDGAVSCSANLLAQRMWTGARNVNGLYQAASYGALSFLNDSNNDGLSDIYDVTIPSTTLGRCTTYYNIAAEAVHELTLRGISLTGFSQVIYYLPNNAHYTSYNNVTGVGAGQICSWAGLAGGGTAYIAGDLCGQYEQHMDVVAHEIGHNLGLDHAGRDLNGDGDLFDLVSGVSEEYNDVSCLMSYGGNHYRHFNAPHKDILGWLQRKTIVTQPGDYLLSAVELPNPPANSSHMITIPNGNRNIYVSYRDAIDPYSAPWIGALMGKVSVHQYYSQSQHRSFLLSTLSDGQTYNDSSNIQVRMLSHSFGQAQVRITFGCSPLAPTLSLPLAPISVGNAPQIVQIGLTNSDPSGCTPSDFQLTLTGPSGINTSPQTFSVSLAPGQSQSIPVIISASPSVLDGSYTLSLTVAATGHSNASSILALKVDRLAPSSPTGLMLN